MAEEWNRVAAVADVPSACPWPEFVVDDVTIVLVRDGDDAVRAVRSWCPHLGTPMTSAQVAGSVIECPRHFYVYDLETGRNTFPGDDEDQDLEVLDVEVRGDDVWVRASAGSAGEGE